ncbi:MAG: Uma2 family endonuclease [Bacteroidota bacterium]
MGDAERLKQNYTFEEYLQLESNSEVKHEFFFGEVFAMAGGSKRHSRIMLLISFALEKRLKNTKCIVYGDSTKTEISHKYDYRYPDVVVTCDEREDDDMSVRFPSVIFEVLSDATEGYDRGEKFKAYQKIESLQHYVLVSQKLCLVECFSKAKEGWLHDSYTKLDQQLQLPSIKTSLPLNEIYEGIEFDKLKLPTQIAN